MYKKIIIHVGAVDRKLCAYSFRGFIFIYKNLQCTTVNSYSTRQVHKITLSRLPIYKIIKHWIRIMNSLPTTV